MKKSTYMDRALKSSDPRFARVLGKLGHVARSDMTAAKSDAEDEDLKSLRAEYQDKFGKKAFHGWDADALREKIAEAVEREEKDV